ncbi:putative immunoglobulin-blocking virulence protein [Mesomycoplasma dispar]|uniref:Immunoglobulin-blocking virulence protein n=1 Tax=Mesomycoplasma dispar TaxID=86660 RepID=A0ABN5DRM4_9BACT|nr:putative immunoglobulin-blocking virulence protein [Mesomycoplasma dispar]ATP59741.1 hypothetical protein CSW10_02220 [Mesomycoplasma dispar]
MVLYLSKRKKFVSISLAATVVVSTAWASSAYFGHILETREIQYSTVAPSTILKNRPNDTNFSPVANTDYIAPPPKKNLPEAPKPSPGPKIEVKKPVYTPDVPTVKKIVNPVPQNNPRSKPKISSPIVSPIKIPTPAKPKQTVRTTTIRTIPRPVPQTQVSRPSFTPPSPKQETYQSVSPDGKYGSAIRALIARTQANIGTSTSNIKSINDKIQELNRQKNEREKSVYWHKNQDLAAWNEAYDQKIRDEEYEKKRKEWDLDYYNKRLARLKQGQLTSEEINLLEKGYTPDPKSDGWEPRNNHVKHAIKANNAKGVAPYESPWANQDSTVLSGLKREGWSGGIGDPSSHITDGEFKSALEKSGVTSGIKLIQYKKNVTNTTTVSGNYDSFTSLVLDSSDPSALQKFSSVLQQLAEKQQDLKEVVLQNVEGKNIKTIEEIISKLPPKIISLRLFVEDAEGLLALSKLENHKLTELSLYSNKQKDTGNWAINPNGLKNVDFIKWDYIDKSKINLYNPSAKLPGSIPFDTLTWSSEQSTPDKINEGLKIAFGSKINQRVFQGVFGGRGGYPPNLDFSKTSQKTFKNIKFDEVNSEFNRQISEWETDTGEKQQANYFIKFNEVSFGIDSDSSTSGTASEKKYTVKLDDFDGQIQKRLNFGPYEFSKIYIKDKDGKQVQGATLEISGIFSAEAKADLEHFLKAAKQTNAFAKIVVDSNLIGQLGNSLEGLPVETKSS